MASNQTPGGRTALQEALRKTRSAFFAVSVFSFFLNLLMLATPLYMLQVFERVLSSGHVQTLLYLTLITIFALLVLRLRINEKIATPTSVVLMAGNAVVGFLWRGGVRGD